MKILMFDGLSILNRAYYALPLLSNSAGEYTNAVFGFMNIFLKFLDEETPDFITVAFDLPVPTFRHEMYGAYKGTRKSMPDELRAQVPLLKNLLAKMGVPVSSCAGFEADDVLGTLAVKAAEKGLSPVVITGDRDLLQIASDKIKIRIPKTKRGKTEVEDYMAAEVFEKYGVSPMRLVDMKALMGDASDNIPGVPGIGEVTAGKIIVAYGTLENAINNAAEIKPKKASENLVEFKEQAILSYELAKIATDAPCELPTVENPQENFWNQEACEEILRLELKSLYKRFNATAPSPAPLRDIKYEVIKNFAEAEKFFANLQTKTGFERTGERTHVSPELEPHPAAFFPVWDTDDSGAFLVGVAISDDTTKYIHLGSRSLEMTLDGVSENLTEAEFVALAKPWLAGDAPKIVFDSKSEIRRLHRYGIAPQNITFDAMLAAYVLDATRPASSPADIAEIYLSETIPRMEDILANKGKRGKDRKTVSQLPEETAAEFAARSSDLIFRAYPVMKERLAENAQEKLLYEMEVPLAVVLAQIEETGIKVCKKTLTNFGTEMENRLVTLTGLICDLAGEDFNINSPAQLGEILFTKLGLKGGKKTTKGFSTAADVLEKIKNAHPIVPLVLEYRTHSKLKSTYVDGMLPLIHPETSRLHSTFHQALTATGRLSSAEPNLQNIPVRTALGRELRKAFVPEDGCVFIAADYSQIELRLLAHISGDQNMIRAFCENSDIHRQTAAQVLGKQPEDITDEERSAAKAVNFGIIYGISAFGLAEDLKIPVKEAESYILGYFAKYPGVKKYLDETISAAKESGFVSTLYNRRRIMPELASPNFNTRSFGERVAMNMPIQGTAADIMKIAMLGVHKRLENLRTKIVLQVHDELLLEAPEEERDEAVRIIKEEMEIAAQLDVPLAVDVKVGKSWYEI